MVGAWFTGRSARAVDDFFVIVDGALAAGIVGVALDPSDPISIEAARTRNREARAGNWVPFEEHLRGVGKRFSQERRPLSTWYVKTTQLYDALAPRIVEAHAAEPAHAGDVLLVLGQYLQRTVSLVGDAYHAVEQSRHARVLDAAIDAVISIDDDGLILELNRSAEVMFQLTRDGAIGRRLSELVIPHRMRAAHEAGMVRARNGEHRVVGRRVELMGLRADGSEIPIELTIVAVPLGDRQTFTAFLRDLSERKRAEASVALWRHALDNAQFGIVISSTENVILSVNRTYEALVGYGPSELVGIDGRQLVARESIPELAGVARQLVLTRKATYETWVVKKDGTKILVLISTSVVELGPGEIVRVSTVIDIDQRHRLEEAIAVGHAAIERLAGWLRIESTVSREFAMASGDPASVMALVSRRLGEVVGDGCVTRLLSDDGEWIEPSTNLYHPDPDVQRTLQAQVASTRQRIGDGLAGRAIAAGKPLVVTPADDQKTRITSVFRDRLNVQTHAALAMPLIARGRTIGVISLFRTTTETPYSDEEVQLVASLADRAGLAIDNATLVTTLEHRVEQRTAALELANQELESFSYTVSHDLRAPLRAIDGFSRALEEDYANALDESGRHYLQRIRSGTDRMATLIDVLLDLSKIKRTSLSLAPVDLSALATEVIDDLRRADPERTVEAIVAPGLVVRGDARLLRIVLVNLIGNAWKFTSRSPQQRIEVGRAPDGTIFVRDSGAGFDMAGIDRLFRPFQRLHAPTDFEGTGIGLATVQRIIAHHGGKLWGASEPSHGATFSFTLP
ncbi:MAG: PAS domain S-box protein [Kofleriaceae bacterium]